MYDCLQSYKIKEGNEEIDLMSNCFLLIIFLLKSMLYMRPFKLFFDLEQLFVQFEALKRNFARSRSEVKAAKESTWLTRHFLQEKL